MRLSNITFQRRPEIFFHMNAQSKNNIIKILRQHLPDLKLVYLFGSEATGETHSNSDIDIAFLTENKIDNLSRFELQEALARKLKKDVDLVDLSLSSDILKMQVIYGENLYARQQEYLQVFENRVMQDYFDLQEMLAPLYKSIKEDKTIYG